MKGKCLYHVILTLFCLILYGFFDMAFSLESIVFLRDNNLWIMDNEGKNQRQLNNIRVNRDLSISRDGGKIAFAKADETYSAAEAKRKQIEDWSDIKEGEAKKTGLYVFDLQSGHQRKLVGELPSNLLPQKKRNITEWADCSLFWSPDGKKLHFNRNFEPYVPRDSSPDTYLLDLDSGVIEYIGLHGVILNWVDEKILYDGEGVFSILDIRTGETVDWGEGHAAISPDGRKVVYISRERKRAGEQYTWQDNLMVKVISSKKTIKILTSSLSEDFESPSWSPDGNKIAFVRTTWKPNAVHQIWRIDADGSNLKKLADNAGSPKWVLVSKVEPESYASKPEQSTQPGISSDKPPIPYEDFGACPYEGCVYREWIATKDTAVFKDRNEGSPIVFTIKKGEKVAAITGVVITVKPENFSNKDLFETGYNPQGL